MIVINYQNYTWGIICTFTWSRPAILADATSEMTTGEAIVEIHGETTNAEAPEAPEANGHPA